jgi:hypothetical protein
VYTVKVTKPELRFAGPDDEKTLIRLQKAHVKEQDWGGLEGYPSDAYWLLASMGGKIVNALGFVDRPEERQVMMLWEPGRQAAIAAHYLMEWVVGDAGDKTLWCVSHDTIPEQTKRMYTKWGFERKGGNGKISIYARGK